MDSTLGPILAVPAKQVARLGRMDVSQSGASVTPALTVTGTTPAAR